MFKKGFTLVELMIVVAIIGILAAIAIPNFVEMQYRAKRAENPACVDGIKTAEMGYDAAFDKFISASTYPDADVNKKTQAWVHTNAAGFQTLGWQPDGEVRGAYSVTTTDQATTAGGDFRVRGVIDVDNDNTDAHYTATKSVNTTFLNNNDTY